MEYNEIYRGYRIKIKVAKTFVKEFPDNWESSFTITTDDGKPLGPSGSANGDSEEKAKRKALERAVAKIDKHLGPP